MKSARYSWNSESVPRRKRLREVFDVMPRVLPGENARAPADRQQLHRVGRWVLANWGGSNHGAQLRERGLRMKTLRGSGCDRLLPAVPVTQYRKKKDGRHAGQSASNKENSVAMNKAVRGAQPFDLSARKPLQDLSQPGIG